MPHKLLLVRSADRNLHLTDLHCVLEGVDVLDAIQIDHKIAADSHEMVGGQLLEQVFQRGLDVVLPVFHLQRAVLPFDFNVKDVVKRHFTQLVANLCVDVILGINRPFDVELMSKTLDGSGLFGVSEILTFC